MEKEGGGWRVEDVEGRERGRWRWGGGGRRGKCGDVGGWGGWGGWGGVKGEVGRLWEGGDKKVGRLVSVWRVWGVGREEGGRGPH